MELAALTDPALLPQTVAAGFGLRDESVEPTDRLAEFLADQRLLLVLDNCEHLVDTCAVLVGKLLAAAEGLRLLATSRQRLHVEGEHLLAVEPFGAFPLPCCVGVNLDPAVVADVEVFEDCLRGGFDEVLALGVDRGADV